MFHSQDVKRTKYMNFLTKINILRKKNRSRIRKEVKLIEPDKILNTSRNENLDAKKKKKFLKNDCKTK